MDKPKFKNKPNKFIETDDLGTVYLPRSSAVAVHVGIKNIESGNKRYVVLTRGEDMSHAGEFCCPCGYVDWNETRLNAAIRELYEETGLYVPYANMYEVSYIDDNPKKFRENITTHYELRLELTTQGVKNLLDTVEKHANMVADEGELTEIRLVNLLDEDASCYAFNHLSDLKRMDENWV